MRNAFGEWLSEVVEQTIVAAIKFSPSPKEMVRRAENVILGVMWPHRNHPLLAKRLAREERR